ncbi:MAG TPA: TonB-dependent receptor plug domain-containing protein [Polyangiaceae bacterium]|jgi:hypothetical protein
MPATDSAYVAQAQPTPATDPATQNEAAGSPPAPPIELNVRGQRAAPASEVITRASARELPGSFGDPLRSVESEPGVTPIVSGLPYFFVRGAPPASVGYFIDGVDVPLLFHAYFGPSVIHPALFDRVDVFKGAAPVNYGRYAGAIIAAQTRAPRYEWNGEASLRVIDAGALLESPFASGRGSALVAGRYSYTGLILSLLDDRTKLRYWDYQTLDSYRLSSTTTLSVFAFGAFDLLSINSANDAGLQNQVGGETQFHRFDLRLDARPSPATHLRVAGTFGYDRSGDTIGTASLRDSSMRERIELSHEFSPDVGLDAGLDARIDQVRLDAAATRFDYLDLTTLFPTRNDGVGGGYFGLRLRPARGISVIPGVRADGYLVEHEFKAAADPRLSVEFALPKHVTVDSSVALSHQRPNFVPGIPAAAIGTLHGGLETGVVYDAGVRWKPGADLTFGATIFRTAFFDVIDPVGGQHDFTVSRTQLNDRTTIQTSGLEARVSRPLTKSVGGFLAYTLSRSTRGYDRLSSISGYDRPHVLQAALTLDFGYSIRGGLRGVFYSGMPALVLNEGPPHPSAAHRTPDFFRLDFRVEKRWNFDEAHYLSAVLEVLNATSAKEVLKEQCGTRCQGDLSGPVVLPSLGVEAGF